MSLPASGPRPEHDPLEDLFVAQFARPEELQPVNLRAVSPFHRALLSIDGTVTRFIEAFRMEPVEVTLVSQEARELPDDHDWLEAAAGSPVIAREVVLRGRHTGRFYAFAASLVLLERLPEEVREQLPRHPQGLGQILADACLETRREILWYGRESPAEPPPGAPSGRLLCRTYRILAGGRPWMLIQEKFPIGDDALPDHH